MVKGFEQMKRFATAARKLMEGENVDPAAGRYSRTLFMSASRRDSDVEEAARIAAGEQGWSLVALQFGSGSKAKGPQGFTVSPNGAGRDGIVRDCALAFDGERHVLVPPAATFHFAIGPDGLERRHGRPANLGAATVRATRGLVAAAKQVDRTEPVFEVHTGGTAA